MKILLYTDCHWSERTSVVTRLGPKYTTRLELLVDSMNWVMRQAEENGCVATICVGDFFDKTRLTAQEITALQDIRWAESLQHYFLVGNHESEEITLQHSTTEIFKAIKATVISKPVALQFGRLQFHCIPYVTESVRKPIEEYITNRDSQLKQVIVSHNDIAGINYGPCLSTVGFSIDEIEANCDLCVNGHIHNMGFVSKKILNLGSFSAHNFTNDSSKYEYGIWIIDCEECSCQFIENPYSLNFYKLDITSRDDFKKVQGLKINAVLSIRCDAMHVSELKEYLETLTVKPLESRIVITRDALTGGEEICDASELVVDHLTRFVQCCHEKIPNTELLEQELTEICK